MDYQALYQFLSEQNAEHWVKQLRTQISKALALSSHGHLSEWLEVIKLIPNIETQYRKLDSAAITIGKADEINQQTQEQLSLALKQLRPWRKGPYSLFGIELDTEWRSDWKWNRLANHIDPLQNRTVLDVGCGNGYHCWRMLGAKAKMVIGIDPALRHVMQFHAIRQLYGEAPNYVLPLRLEDLPPNLSMFDTVFSMGVLYHRRSPFDHLLELKDCLRPGGQLILETLIIEGEQTQVLVPENRYAQMRNVWFIPSCKSLHTWLKRCGFVNIRLIDVTKTTTEEQRNTQWMQSQSLKDFLQPGNDNMTIEGLPAPIRAIFLADRP